VSASATAAATPGVFIDESATLLTVMLNRPTALASPRENPAAPALAPP
jgi:hypothetical protein